MSINITIGNTVIPFPSSGQDANWSEPIIQFAEAVALQFLTIASPFNIPSTVQILSADLNTSLPLSGALFPHANVRAFVLTYSIYRVNTTMSIFETGQLTGTYDTFNAAWTLQDEYNGIKQSSGQPYHSFSMSGDQLQLTTVAIGGTYDGNNSKISFSATTQLVHT